MREFATKDMVDYLVETLGERPVWKKTGLL